MIKEVNIEKIFVNKTIIPNYWMENNQVNNKIINTTRIIPISNDNGKFKKEILNAINNATETIMLCSFILSDDDIISALENACERKVRIYLLFSTDIQLDKEFKKDPTNFDKETLSSHKKFLKRIYGKALARSSQLHAKYLLVDYGTSNHRCFISTANFTKEALSRNQELGIILKSLAGIKQVYFFFQRGFWEESTHEYNGDWLPIKDRGLKPLALSDRIISTSKNNRSLKEKIKSLIEKTTGPLIISSYSFKIDNELTKLLIKISTKRNLIILTRPREINVPALNKMLSGGAKILCYDFIHAKFIFAPNEEKGIIMSANFDNRGLEDGYEIGVFLNELECNELSMISKFWIDNATYSYESSKNIKEMKLGRVKFQDKNGIIKYEILSTKTIEQIKEPSDLREIKELNEITFDNNFIDEKTIVKRVIVKRKIIPPKLPTNSTKIKNNPFPYDLYIHKNKKYLVLKNEKQLDTVLEKYHNEIRKIILVTG